MMQDGSFRKTVKDRLSEPIHNDNGASYFTTNTEIITPLRQARAVVTVVDNLNKSTTDDQLPAPS